jgi:iron complex transport system substrate-binding protein
MTASAALVAACSSPKPGEVAKDGSVTVKHIFGETKIPAPPKRVVSAGFTEQDDLLALGVVPIAVTDWFGGQPFGVWPWAQPKLGAAQPVVLNLNDGIQAEQIASLKPDLIVATNAGLDQDTYTKLSGIAPTIAQSGPDAFFEPWKDQATDIGQAVFKADDMTKLIAAERRQEQPPVRRQKGAAGRRQVLRGQRARHHAGVAHRLPDRDGLHHPRHRRRLGVTREDGVACRRRRRADMDDRER